MVPQVSLGHELNISSERTQLSLPVDHWDIGFRPENSSAAQLFPVEFIYAGPPLEMPTPPLNGGTEELLA